MPTTSPSTVVNNETLIPAAAASTMLVFPNCMTMSSNETTIPCTVPKKPNIGATLDTGHIAGGEVIGAAEHFGHRTPCGAHEPDGPDPLRLCPRDEMIGCGEHDERIVGRCIVDPPLDETGDGFSIEIVPRTGGDAGFELATGTSVCVVLPEDAAAAMREASVGRADAGGKLGP